MEVKYSRLSILLDFDFRQNCLKIRTFFSRVYSIFEKIFLIFYSRFYRIVLIFYSWFYPIFWLPTKLLQTWDFYFSILSDFLVPGKIFLNLDFYLSILFNSRFYPKLDFIQFSILSKFLAPGKIFLKFGHLSLDFIRF